VNKVEPNSAASKAGIKVGDVIVAVDGEKVTNVNELRNKIAFKGAGAKVTLKVYRNGHFITLTAHLKALKPKVEKVEDIRLLNGLVLKQERNRVIVDKVEPHSYAAMIGFEKGDVIEKVKTIKTGSWVKVRSIDELKKLLKGLDRGDALVEIRRSQNTIIIIQL
jgi:serine protease Do